MIRKLLNGDIDRVADIWLKRNIEQKRNAQFLAYRELCIFVSAPSGARF